MTEPDPMRNTRRGLWAGILSAAGLVAAAILEIVPELLNETFANMVAGSVLVTAWFSHNWLWIVLGLVLLFGVGTVRFVYRARETRARNTDQKVADQRQTRSEPSPVSAPAQPLPPPVALAGRHDADRVLAARLAAEHHVAVVTGVPGIGASAVGIAAGWMLTNDPGRQRYVDLRETPDAPENQRRSLIRVLRAVGLQPGYAADPTQALKEMAENLPARTVLVLDNVDTADQISWLTARGLPGVYVIACGNITDAFGRELTGELPAGGEPVKIQPLEDDAVLELLARQGGDGAIRAVPRHSLVHRIRRIVTGGSEPRPGNTIAGRIAADPAAARELAGYLRLPRVAIDMGRWLAANPHAKLADVVKELRQAEPSTELAVILGKQLAGASPGARRLLALLASVPAATYPESAVARLAGTTMERTGDHLAELASRSLVVWTGSARSRITVEARRLAVDSRFPHAPGRKKADKARARLVAYYARFAVARAENLRDSSPAEDSAAAQEWLRAEDTTLLRLLCDQHPPSRAGRDLWRIAGVLDTWFARENRPEDRRAAAEAMRSAAEARHDGAANATACLRLAAVARDGGDFATDGGFLEDAHRLAGNRADLLLQVQTAWTAHYMVVGDLDAADNALQRCREFRPRRDQVGRITDLVNQAALELRRGRRDGARVALARAGELAARVGDIAGQAQVHELAGVAEAGERNQAADQEWEQALALYERAADVIGEARCLQHQGTLRLASRQGTGDGAVTAEATGLLDGSLELRGDQKTGLGVALAHLYIAEAVLADARRARTQNLSSLPALARHHLGHGLAALEPWRGRANEPPEVLQARERLNELQEKWATR